MGRKTILRTAIAASSVLATALIGVSIAMAQEALPASEAPQVDFSDPHAALERGATLNLSARDDRTARFAPQTADRTAEGPRRMELELAAGGGDAPLDVSIAQRASFGGDENGDINRQGRGSELRVGRGLVGERDGRPSPNGSTYMFVASDNEALTWQPGQRGEFGGSSPSLAMQERAEVGDLSAGVTYERNGIQASLAYVEREESTQVGTESFSQDQSFTGVTLTMRR